MLPTCRRGAPAMTITIEEILIIYILVVKVVAEGGLYLNVLYGTS